MRMEAKGSLALATAAEQSLDDKIQDLYWYWPRRVFRKNRITEICLKGTMIVEKVSATIRYSQDTGKGTWKVVELGAEASIGQRNDWKQTQSELYYQLGDQLRTLWSNGSSNGAFAVANGQNGAESLGDEP